MIWLFLSGWLVAALLCSFILWCAVHLSDGLDDLVEEMLKEQR